MIIKLSAKLVLCVYLPDDEEFNEILISGTRPQFVKTENYWVENLPLYSNSEEQTPPRLVASLE